MVYLTNSREYFKIVEGGPYHMGSETKHRTLVLSLSLAGAE